MRDPEQCEEESPGRARWSNWKDGISYRECNYDEALTLALALALALALTVTRRWCGLIPNLTLRLTLNLILALPLTLTPT